MFSTRNRRLSSALFALGAFAATTTGCEAPEDELGDAELRRGFHSFDRPIVDLDSSDYDDDWFFSDFVWDDARDVFQMADSCEGARFDIRRPSGSWASYETPTTHQLSTNSCLQIIRNIVDMPASVQALEDLGFSLPDTLYDKLADGYTLEEVELWSTVYSGIDCDPPGDYERHRVNLDFSMRGPGGHGGYGFQSVVYGSELEGEHLEVALTDCQHYTTDPGSPGGGPSVGPG